MKKVRIGIIGIGEIGTTKHLTQLCRHSDEVEIAALCDILPERCEKAIKDFGLNAKIYTDYREICADASLDVIHVCTPNPLHKEMSILAMENGKLLGFDDFTEAYRADNPGALVEEKPAEPEKQEPAPSAPSFVLPATQPGTAAGADGFHFNFTGVRPHPSDN